MEAEGFRKGVDLRETEMGAAMVTASTTLHPVPLTSTWDGHTELKKYHSTTPRDVPVTRLCADLATIW
ncbi:MAG: hypothetical protein KJ060_07795 [Candidatus Hydrogenedentes bacterium]|nr:hypothetical protein [Candidatus Hydrogenedentota bacterium]